MFDIGLGKTWTALMVYERLKEQTPDLRLLVVCPLSLLVHTWLEHIKRIYPDLTVSNLRDDKYWKDSDVSLINFDNIIRKPTLDKVTALLSQGNWMCVIDESSRLRDNKSLTTKTMLSLRHKFKHRICMSGTPATNSELEYWAQLEFIEPGALHPSFHAFRNIYFYLSDRNGNPLSSIPSREGMMQLFKRGAHYVPIKSKSPQLMKRIGRYATFAKKEDCLKDLPETLEEIREVELNSAEGIVYKEMKKHLVAEIGREQISANNALTKLLKLRECTSGFIINEQGKNVPINHELSSKITALKELILEIGDEQAIIWTHFDWEAGEIERLILAMGKTVATLHGKTKDKDGSIANFRAGRAQFLVAHPLSGGVGLNLQNCHISIYFSVSYSHEQMVQSAGRTHRSGQTEKCLFIYLLAKKTIDFEIFDILKKKKQAVEVLESYLK